ncbi:hypothetical protein Mal4_55590 [Maioricimonas rarisocia]|uniref:Uncharacterized protein n=1 Tax=Maioricimonas rarisocia TaxID=2528026 RepID=A0A517ZFG2_9PLAN|nr:hypothetical protein [Maioricimonas rarisocia]QDU41194.1 hypothetical protein Mal4_55590 [Maioricimonas rarisocia]
MRRLTSLFASCLLGVTLAGCGAEEPETPPPAPPGNDAPETEMNRPEAALEAGGADAALPPEQQTSE